LQSQWLRGFLTEVPHMARLPARYVGPLVATGNPSAEANPQTSLALALPDKPSVAVLPFSNLSGDPEQEYAADGMVEDIIAGLSCIRWLLVVARNSSFTYKEKTVDVKRVGRELGVRYLLEGSLRKDGNRLRISAQMIEAEAGGHLWAERYDRRLGAIFALQDEIALSVVGAIEPSLRRAKVDRVTRKRPESLDAYDLVLRAQPDVYSGMPERATKALVLLERALAFNPTYAPCSGCHRAWLGQCARLDFRGTFHRNGRARSSRRIRRPSSALT
jgi:TolB-like protein